MKIAKAEIPSEGLHLQGELDPEAYDLHLEFPVAWAPISYSLFVVPDNDGFSVSGSLETVATLDCNRCLEPFPLHIQVEDFACEIENDDLEVIDLTPYIRDDTLLRLPIAASCQLDENNCCQHSGRSFPAGPDVFGEQRRDEVWGELDSLKKKLKTKKKTKKR